MKKETTAKLRHLRMAPRKLRLLTGLIRGMRADAAIHQLDMYSTKQAARPVSKLLKSAIANAVHNDNIDPATLVVRRAFVDGGPILYRWMPKSFGRAGKIRKRTSHVTIVVEGEVRGTDKEVKEVIVEGTVETTETTKKATPKKATAKKTTAKKAVAKPAVKKAAKKK